MGKVDYASNRGRVYEPTQVANLNVALDELATQSTRIDSSNIREEGLDHSVVYPGYELVGRQAFSNWPGVGAELDLTLGTWSGDWAAVGFPFETGAITFNGGDTLVVRVAINLETNWSVAPPVGTALHGIPGHGTTDRPIRFSIRLRIDNLTTGASAPGTLLITERVIGGPFQGNTVARDYEVPGRHGSVSTMTIVPNIYNLLPPGTPASGDELNFAVEYKTNNDGGGGLGPCVGQAVIYVMRYPKSQDTII